MQEHNNVHPYKPSTHLSGRFPASHLLYREEKGPPIHAHVHVHAHSHIHAYVYTHDYGRPHAHIPVDVHAHAQVNPKSSSKNNSGSGRERLLPVQVLSQHGDMFEKAEQLCGNPHFLPF